MFLKQTRSTILSNLSSQQRETNLIYVLTLMQRCECLLSRVISFKSNLREVSKLYFHCFFLMENYFPLSPNWVKFSCVYKPRKGNSITESDIFKSVCMSVHRLIWILYLPYVKTKIRGHRHGTLVENVLN